VAFLFLASKENQHHHQAMGPSKTCGFFCCNLNETSGEKTMFNLTITILPSNDGNNPETHPARETALKDWDLKCTGSSASPPDL
jgi:hypothetical protein